MKVKFSLPDKDGKKVSSEDLKGKWAVVYFYPRDNTPGCTLEAIDFTNKLSKFNKLNCEVIGVSSDSERSHCNFAEKHELKVTLLSDKDKEVAKRFGAFGAKKMYGKEFEGIIRSTFLINPQGEIVHSWKNVKVPGHVDSVLDKLKELY